jgi:alcohol dehydrogenase YqhD (iron-dependent ADH family)
MQPFQFSMPTKIIFGAGELRRLGKETRRIASRVLLVTGRTALKKYGILDKITKLLYNNNVDYILYDQVEPNPTVPTVDTGAEMARKMKAEAIIAAGGGSVMDAAKGMAIVARCGGSIWDYTILGKSAKEALPVITIPTLAATSSEADNIGVVTNSQTGEKVAFFSYSCFPKVAIIDPSLTTTVPMSHTLDGIVDIFCHIMETYFSCGKPTPIQDRLSEALISVLMENTAPVLENPQDLEVRSQISWCSTLALSGPINAGRSGPAIMHMLEHPISGLFDISHGRGLALILPRYLRYIAPVRKEKIVQFGKQIFHITSDNPEETIQHLIQWLKIMKLYITFQDLSIVDSAIPIMADMVIRHYADRNGVISKPRPTGKLEVEKIYLACTQK